MRYLTLLSFILFFSYSSAQEYSLSGKISDGKNKRLLYEVEVSLYDMDTDGFIKSVESDKFGEFSFTDLKAGSYTLRCNRRAYYSQEIFLDVDELADKFLEIKMNRLPGYEFEGTIKELISYKTGALGSELKNTKIEVVNNTLLTELVIIEDEPDNTFKVIFERGNHYTILLRKKGYFAKRIEVYVDVEDCILCFEGLGTYASPEIESAMTDHNQRGSIITDIPMKKIIKDEAIVLDNIYYDYNKYDIREDARPALDKLVSTLKRNPIIIELSSHTDSRGKDEYNMTLSQKRAQAAVDYIVKQGIKISRISAKGYGETKLVNKCTDGSNCTEQQHQENRRTEFTVTEFLQESSFDKKSLLEIIKLERAQGSRLKESILIME